MIEQKDYSQQLQMRFHEAPKGGEYYRDRGMEKALSHADLITEKWSERAYNFLRDYMRYSTVFMTEDVRAASKGLVPEPPSNRAWGAVIMRAIREGRIRRIGFQAVKNAKAHCTPAALWQVI